MHWYFSLQGSNHEQDENAVVRCGKHARRVSSAMVVPCRDGIGAVSDRRDSRYSATVRARQLNRIAGRFPQAEAIPVMPTRSAAARISCLDISTTIAQRRDLRATRSWHDRWCAFYRYRFSIRCVLRCAIWHMQCEHRSTGSYPGCRPPEHVRRRNLRPPRPQHRPVYTVTECSVSVLGHASSGVVIRSESICYINTSGARADLIPRTCSACCMKRSPGRGCRG